MALYGNGSFTAMALSSAPKVRASVTAVSIGETVRVATAGDYDVATGTTFSAFSTAITAGDEQAVEFERCQLHVIHDDET